MKTSVKATILLALAVAAVGAMMLNKSKEPLRDASPLPTASRPLPKLIDLGADKCIPCKAMAPILEQLRTDFAGQFNVEFIDVWKNPDAGTNHHIELIPTQIFFTAAGKELYRHQGFFSRDDILRKWKDLGFTFAAVPSTNSGSAAK